MNVLPATGSECALEFLAREGMSIALLIYVLRNVGGCASINLLHILILSIVTVNASVPLA